jgi:branched-chain amino acid aminotransferase
MYSFQAKHYASYQDVPASILSAFMEQTVLTETIRVSNGSLLFWEEHYLRLMASMRILRMDIPLTFTLPYLESQLLDYCATKDTENFNGLVKMHVVAAAKPTADVPIPPSLFSITAEKGSGSFSFKHDTYPIDLYKDHYLSKGLYSSLESVHAQWRNMAWVYVYENHLSDGIILNEDKQLVESLRGALFLVKGNTISTPHISAGCRKTVYRNLLTALLYENETFELVEEDISPFAIQKADELFVLEGVEGIKSVGQYRKKKFKSEKTQQIFSLLLNKLA